MKNIMLFMLLVTVVIPIGFLRSESGDSFTVPFEISAHHLVVKGKINRSENEYLFIVDTGARTMLDPMLVDELHLKKQGFQAKISILDLSGLQIENIFCFTTFPFHLFRESGYPIRGIIGSDLMSRFKVTFDFVSKQILFSEDFSSISNHKKGIYLQFETHPINLAPVVPFKTGDKQMKGMIDTGQPYPLVFPMGDFEKMKDSLIKDVISSNGIIVKWPGTQPERNHLARLHHCQFGHVDIKDLVCLFGEIPPMLSMPLIGNEFLSRFTMIINYPKKEMLLVPVKNRNFETNRMSFGLELRNDGTGKVFAEGIWMGSPADRAGLRVGDQVVRFEGKDVAEKNFPRLLNAIHEKSVTSLTIGIKTDGGIRTVTLKKSPLFK